MLIAAVAAQALLPAAVRAQETDAAAAAQDRAVTMHRFLVSATRIDKNPWRYASLPGFEVLSRASEDKTSWWLDALQRGHWLVDGVLPKDWLALSPTPDTIIVDDADIESVPTGKLHSQPITFRRPADALTWGHLSEKANVWNDTYEARDHDTLSVNSNVHDVDTETQACVIGLEPIFRCTPPLPRWLIAGLLGENCGVFRESFLLNLHFSARGSTVRAEGPGTLWISLDETKRLLNQLRKDRKIRIAIPPLAGLFEETPPAGGDSALWQSEAGLFVRWGLMGPGRDDPAMSRAFLELVRRARREPVTGAVFAECFGFGYAAMEGRLETFLRQVLARPTSVDLDMPRHFENPDLAEATADQIGRILGDWLRMEGDSLGRTSPSMGAEFLGAAGRMLERAYRDDNGLPPDVDPAGPGGRDARSAPEAAARTVVMRPFVVTADRIHDPGLLAVYGLFEHDTGNEGKAREFLEAAVKAGAVRPRANLVLSELRYAEAIARPEGTEGRLGARQAASILEPLQAVSGYPAVPEACAIVVKTWLHGEAKPAGRDVDQIAEGAALFPRYSGLAYSSAILCAREGYAAQAAGLLDLGLAFTPTALVTTGDSFGRLRTIMESAVAARAPYPRIYDELARIRLREALARPAGSGGKLDAGQVTSVAAPLRSARNLTQRQINTYVLFARVLEASASAPAPADFEMLEEGLRCFPDEPGLAASVAALKRGRGPAQVPGTAR